MIRRFAIQNFKSLVDFELPPGGVPLGKFTCLVGLNGAGKSTVLQAFDFAGQIAGGNCAAWLKARGWEWPEIQSRFHGTRKRVIGFSVSFEFDEFADVVWEGDYDVKEGRCIVEKIRSDGREVLSVNKDQVQMRGVNDSEVPEFSPRYFDYYGSILSILNAGQSNFHPVIGAVKDYASSLQAMDLLSPQAMRKRSRDGEEMGMSGERLSAYIYDLPPVRRAQLQAKVREFYPNLDELKSNSNRSGWRDLGIQERWADSKGRKFETLARHMNDGMLRLLAILARTQFDGANGDRHCILFDEIENGINLELTEKLVRMLLDARDQVIVTTHSPMILNWLPDERAGEAVVLIYRNGAGHTKAVRFFDLPTARKRLGVLGAGEAFVDVDLNEIAAEAELLEATTA